MNFVDLQKAWLKNLPEDLLCVDVGARWGADNALLALRDRAKLVCFDPDEAECARLQRDHPKEQVEYVPLALSSDGRELALNITRQPACSSIFPPIPVLYTDYPVLVDITPERVEMMRSTTLDRHLDAMGLRFPDLMKLDTQGSELDILQGAIASLASVLMIDVEVEFNPLYEGQALFSDVDQFLRSHGFALWRLPFLAHYTPEHFPAASTLILTNSAPPGCAEAGNPGNGQVFWAQAHYVRRDLLLTDSRPIERTVALKAAAIASAYGYWDLSLMALNKCTETVNEAAQLIQLLRGT